MKKYNNRSLLTLIFCLAMLPGFSYAIVNWSPGAGDVVNDDLQINGNVQLNAGANYIRATTQNVNVTMTASSVVRGNDTIASVLYLVTDNGYSITFNITFDLEFRGSAAGQKLLIVQSGNGSVFWQVNGGTELTYTSFGGSGGTEYWTLMDATNPPQTWFTRDTSVSTALVTVGAHSLISYLSSTGTVTGSDSATITFNPSNSSSGCMALQILDTGSVDIAGHYTTNSDGKSIIVPNIQKATPSGNNAQFNVINPGQTGSTVAGMYITNANKTFAKGTNGEELNLLFDPFLTLGVRADINKIGAFSGIRYGFTLGSNATMGISDYTWVKYVGLALDQTPAVTAIPGFSQDPDSLIKQRNPSAFFVDQYLLDGAVPASLIFGNQAALYFVSGVNSNGFVNNGLSSLHPFTINTAVTPGVGNAVFDIEGQLNVFDVFGATAANIQVLSLEVESCAGTGGLFVGSTPTIFPARTFAIDPSGYLHYNSAYFMINNHLILNQVSLMHTDENHTVVKKNSCISEPTYVGGETYTLLPSDPTDLGKILARPKIEFFNSQFLINTSVALTGVDLLVPNEGAIGICGSNTSTFTFFYNGYNVDHGTGRNMILGTLIGSYPAGIGESISTAAQLDVMQIAEDCVSPGSQLLTLTVAANDATIVPAITGNIINQVSTHSIYLNTPSNISIGTNANTTGFDIDTLPTVQIAGNSFSFDTASAQPQNVGVTGQGGIFVDLNGTFEILQNYSATINTMVTKSHNGIVNLPLSEVMYRNGVGLTVWQPNMADPAQRVIIAAGESLSDFSLNWDLQVIKAPYPAVVPPPTDYVEDTFIPYPITTAYVCTPESSLVVGLENITAIPTIQGEVDQFQLQGSRYSDPAHIKVDGGTIQELVFLQGCEPGEYPGAVVVLTNGGTVGIGSADRNADSVFAATQLGRNGVVFIADAGGGRVVLNNDVFVQGACAFLLGPNFDPATDLFEIIAYEPHEIRVEKDSMLDLRGINNGAVLDIEGYASIRFEPGSTLLLSDDPLSQGTLRFDDNAQLNFSPSIATTISDYFAGFSLGGINNTLSGIVSTPASGTHNAFAPLTGYGSGLQNTDQFRVRIVGAGTIELTDNSIANLPLNAFVGIETINDTNTPCGTLEIPVTVITLRLRDSGQFLMGQIANHATGGVLQVGNVVERSRGGESPVTHIIGFTLELDGDNAQFVQGGQSFFGLNVGVARPALAQPLIAGSTNAWNYGLVDTMFDVGLIAINQFNGEWTHNRIYSGDNANASLLAIGIPAENAPVFDISFGAEIGTLFNMTTSDSNILGGGNMVLIAEGAAATETTPDTRGVIAPIVLTEDVATGATVTGGTSLRLLGTSMFSSYYMRAPRNSSVPLGQIVTSSGLTASAVFDLWKMTDALTINTNKTNLACTGPTGENFRVMYDQMLLGYVFGAGAGAIRRVQIPNSIIMSGLGGTGTGSSAAGNAQVALETGAVTVTLNTTTGAVTTVQTIVLQ